MAHWTDFYGDAVHCNTIRPGTLGYQVCQRLDFHAGEHRSQDGKTWPAGTFLCNTTYDREAWSFAFDDGCVVTGIGSDYAMALERGQWIHAEIDAHDRSAQMSVAETINPQMGGDRANSAD